MGKIHFRSAGRKHSPTQNPASYIKPRYKMFIQNISTVKEHLKKDSRKSERFTKSAGMVSLAGRVTQRRFPPECIENTF